jgi:hypothetical protein
MITIVSPEDLASIDIPTEVNITTDPKPHQKKYFLGISINFLILFVKYDIVNHFSILN